MAPATPAYQTQVQVSDLAELVATASRLLIRMSNTPPLKSQKVGIAEWVVLSTLSKMKDANANALAKQVGATGPRLSQILATLKKSDLITVAGSAGDSKKPILTLTAKGRMQLSEIDSKFNSTLMPDIASRPRAVIGATRNMKRIIRMVSKINKASKAALAA